ncbi:RHS repeat domain-containing protein [Paenibacillus sp. L3-i20]
MEKHYYDANNNVAKKIDRKGQESTYVYNNRNRLITKTGCGSKN